MGAGFLSEYNAEANPEVVIQHSIFTTTELRSLCVESKNLYEGKILLLRESGLLIHFDFNF